MGVSATARLDRIEVPRGPRCFNKLNAWRGIAMRTDKTAPSYHATITLTATLIWIKTDLIHTP